MQPGLLGTLKITEAKTSFSQMVMGRGVMKEQTEGSGGGLGGFPEMTGFKIDPGQAMVGGGTVRVDIQGLERSLFGVLEALHS